MQTLLNNLKQFEDITGISISELQFDEPMDCHYFTVYARSQKVRVNILKKDILMRVHRLPCTEKQQAENEIAVARFVCLQLHAAVKELKSKCGMYETENIEV